MHLRPHFAASSRLPHVHLLSLRRCCSPAVPLPNVRPGKPPAPTISNVTGGEKAVTVALSMPRTVKVGSVTTQAIRPTKASRQAGDGTGSCSWEVGGDTADRQPLPALPLLFNSGFNGVPPHTSVCADAEVAPGQQQQPHSRAGRPERVGGQLPHLSTGHLARVAPTLPKSLPLGQGCVCKCWHA